MSTGILPQSGQQQFDNATGAFLNGGLLHIYDAGTTTPAAIFSDFLLTSPLSDPIVLNSSGRIPAIYSATASVRMKLYNSASVQQTDIDNIAMSVAATSGGGGTTIVPQQTFLTGDVKIAFTDQPIDGYVRLNGRTIGSATSGATERANADAQSLFLALWGFANVSVVTGKGASAAADWSANKQLTLPDCAGRLIGGLDNMGNGAAGRITAATITGPTVIGATGGAQTVTLDATMIPAHSHASPAVTDPGHTHTYTAPSLNNQQYGVSAAGAPNSIFSQSSGSTATGITLAATTGSIGGGAAHSNMPPTMLFTIYVRL